MDLIPLSSRRLWRENRGVGSDQPSAGCRLLGSNQALCPPALLHPLSGVSGLAQAEKGGCCDVSSIIPGCHG